MDENLENLSVQQKGSKNFPTSFVLVFLLGVILGGGVSTLIRGYFNTSTLEDKNLSTQPRQFEASKDIFTPQIREEDLPIGLELLKNQIVYEWRGSFQGKVVGKGEHSLTVEDDKGNRIVLTDITPDIQMRTGFFNKKDDRILRKFTDLEFGETVRGEFWVYKGQKNTAVAGIIIVYREGEE